MESSAKLDLKVIACNYAEATSSCAKGALCYVSDVKPGHKPSAWQIHIVARSRSGRWIFKWERLRRLDNFRMKTLPPAHPRYPDIRIETFNCESILVDLQKAKGQNDNNGQSGV